MPGRWKRIHIIFVQLVVFELLGCSLANHPFITAAILPSNAMTMTIEGLVQRAVPNAQRPPQVPLDVDQYPVAPHGLELEQVHVFVRHGMSSHSIILCVSGLEGF
jgi:hypothetical protein